MKIKMQKTQKRCYKKKTLIWRLTKTHNIFTEWIKNIALISNDDKRMEPINLRETYAYGTNKDLVSKKEGIKCNNLIIQYKDV